MFRMMYLFSLILSTSNPYILLILLLLIALYSLYIIQKIIMLQWFSYLIFLVLVGGLLIMFLYLISLIPKEMMIFFPMSFLMGIIFINFVHSNSFFQHMNYMNYTPQYLFFYPIIIFYSIMYLLFTLFVATTLVSLKEGPLRLM